MRRTKAARCPRRLPGCVAAQTAQGRQSAPIGDRRQQARPGALPPAGAGAIRGQLLLHKRLAAQHRSVAEVAQPAAERARKRQPAAGGHDLDPRV